MSNKRIAGTVILNLKDGSKEFLILPVGELKTFITTKNCQEMTALSSILNFFKEKVQLDITSIDLLELTNAHTATENIPLFVFEMNEKEGIPEINKKYKWEKPSELKILLSSYDIKGVPMF